MSAPSPKILVAADDRHQLDTICRGLLLHGCRCKGVSMEQALDALAGDDEGFQLLLTDLTTSGRRGFELVERIRMKWPELPMVVITDLAGTALADIREMNIPVLKKPFDPDTLDAVIRQALETGR